VSGTEIRDDGTLFDWEHVFGRRAPRVVDIGCGTGEFLIESSRSRPTHDHLGIDEVPAIIDKAVKASVGLANVRFVKADAVTWLFERLGGLDEIHVLHPQPYDEGREALVSARFLERAWAALKPEGILVLQTDSRPYWNYLVKAVAPWFEAGEEAEVWPTKRAMVAHAKKLRIRRMVARRKERPMERSTVPAFRPTRRTRLRTRNERHASRRKA
jgi:tRNA (guanine-N7-)-methyltransferase